MDIRVVGVVGAGTMGAGVAQIALQGGLTVVLNDLSSEALAKARDGILGRLARLVEKGQLDPELAASADARLRISDDLNSLAPCDLIVEAIVEAIEPKQALFAALESVVGPDSILATNTSSLSVARIGARCKHRNRVCGLHFFNPVPLMKLVEVVGTPDTAPAVLERVTALMVKLGKTVVSVPDWPGFLVNLGGRAYVTEALHVLQEGVADAQTVDRIMREAVGFRMGPFELMDLTGIDVNYPASTGIWAGFQNDPRIATTVNHQALFNAGRFGRKTGQGFHAYCDAALSGPEARLADDGTSTLDVRLPEGDLLKAWGANGLQLTQDVEAPVLLGLAGEDLTTACLRLGLDPQRTVAIDDIGRERRFITLMTAPGPNTAVDAVKVWLEARGFGVAVVGDSVGFVAPRLIAMIANLGCEMAQIGVASPADIDMGLKLGLNYPKGPLEFGAWLGPRRALALLEGLQAITGSDRYRPSLWLRRRALLGLPLDMADSARR
jgi:3-hydroxybutyryl-CoA dehydrogenase